MASTLSTGTPPPPPELSSPPGAPRFGSYLDDWQPHVRKSARISSQRFAARTPSPHFASTNDSSTPLSKRARNNAAMASPDRSPRKNQRPAPDFVRRASGQMSTDCDASASSAGANGMKAKSSRKAPSAALSRSTGMLPTPSKTPQKPPNPATSANIKSFARNLFSPDNDSELLSPQPKRAKVYNGLSMDSFSVETEEEPIAIFTDSQDRVPEKDQSSSNPFYGNTNSSPEKRRPKPQFVRIPGEGAVPVEEAAQRKDGMIFVFRGKKVWRKNQPQQARSDDEDGFERAAQSHGGKVLFPAELTEEMIEDEEATTDIEDHQMSDTAEDTPPQTPTKYTKLSAKTPTTPRFAPVSPPSTKRTTRATNRLGDEDTPMKRSGSSKRVADLATESRAKRARA